jgi:hypothetical protein
MSIIYMYFQVQKKTNVLNIFFFAGVLNSDKIMAD